VAGVPNNIFDLNFSIDGTSCSATAGSTTVGLDHTFVNDLQIVLNSPSPGPTSVLVINRTDGGGNNFCQTLLDDETANPSIQTAATAPFTGTFKPNAALSGFRGLNANGTWNLSVTDFFVGDIGNIRAFSLIITPTNCTTSACSLTCPANITTPATGPGGAVVNYPEATVTGGCGVLNYSTPSGSTFPVGTTTVTVTGAGGATCTFDVTVTSPCTITCPANISQNSDPNQNGAVVNYPAPSTTGSCGTINCSPASGSFFPDGTTTVTCTSTAGPGCNFTVTVRPPRYWTSAGSTATADEDSTAKVSFDDFAAQLKDGITGTATVRYNITAVRGISAFCPATQSIVNVRFRNSDNTGVHAQVKFEIHRTHILNGGNDIIYTFNSNGLGAGSAFTSASTAPNIDFDFSNYIYWIEGTIFRDQVGQFADLGAIQIYESAGSTPCP
jgi:subtilisin-like proprotein convertase family protein